MIGSTVISLTKGSALFETQQLLLNRFQSRTYEKRANVRIDPIEDAALHFVCAQQQVVS
jgi:hypothetical protein